MGSEPKPEMNIFKKYIQKRKIRKIVKMINEDLSGPGWDDYDKNGIPYWAKTGFIDPDEGGNNEKKN